MLRARAGLFEKARRVGSVAQLVRYRLHKIRGNEALVAGLCHPSMELRELALFEMDKFGEQLDPFVSTSGIVVDLKTAVQNDTSIWYTRAAAILLPVKIAQMDRCQQCDGRNQLLHWII